MFQLVKTCQFKRMKNLICQLALLYLQLVTLETK